MNMQHVSKEHSFFMGGKVKPLARDMVSKEIARIGVNKTLSKLQQMGIVLDSRYVSQMHAAMDAGLQPTVTQGSSVVPIQFLQNWLPGFVNVLTQAMNIDEIVGISTMGTWEDAEIVQGIMELTGHAVLYGDYTNIPYSSWNANFVRRSIVAFEEGMMVGEMEERRASRIRVDTASQKRMSAALALEYKRNEIGFSGFNSGNNLTYGFLNDPGLGSYQTVAAGASTFTTWNKKTFLEICNDIRQMIQGLRSQSGDRINPKKTPITLAIATDCVDYLSQQSDFGKSVQGWLDEAYPNIRVCSAPELNDANGGANVAYMFADVVNDSSTDDGRTFMQVVPAKFFLVGIQKLSKNYSEDYSMSTAGTMCKRPYANYRITGI
jgi:hypothetical protein